MQVTCIEYTSSQVCWLYGMALAQASAGPSAGWAALPVAPGNRAQMPVHLPVQCKPLGHDSWPCMPPTLALLALSCPWHCSRGLSVSCLFRLPSLQFASGQVREYRPAVTSRGPNDEGVVWEQAWGGSAAIMGERRAALDASVQGVFLRC